MKTEILCGADFLQQKVSFGAQYFVAGVNHAQ
jgi:hypothetical protein